MDNLTSLSNVTRHSGHFEPKFYPDSSSAVVDIDRFGGWESTNTETKQEYLLYGLQCNVHVYVCARHIFVLFDFTNDLSV
jgi:hypothetical protein